MFMFLHTDKNQMTDVQKEQLFDLVCLADKEFIPYLSSREGTKQTDFSGSGQSVEIKPEKYFKQLMEQQFILAMEEDGRVVGFMSYIPGYRLPVEPMDEVTYVSTIIVHPDYRRQGITSAFYDRIEKEAEKVATRTWSTNSEHLGLLDGRGYCRIKNLPNDRGAGIDTVYFMKITEE